MDKMYYINQGQRDALSYLRRGDAAQSFPYMFAREATSWQARAYWAGFDAMVAKFSAAQPEDVSAALQSPTGRIVSTQPNLQSLPINSPEAEKIKKALRKAFYQDPPATPPTPTEKTPPARSWQAPEAVPGAALTTNQLPDGPRAHFRDLCRQLETEQDPKRGERLARAAQRVWDKWVPV